MEACHVAWRPMARAWAARSAGLTSTRCRSSARWKPGAGRAVARSASAIRVPRPGPSSTRRTGEGLPASSQVAAAQAPSSSPKTWLTSGAVTKSPAAPIGPAPLRAPA
jgi:hypothetical protein